MFDTKITYEQRQYAQRIVEEYDFGHRGKFDGTTERQFIGILGETVMADALEMPRPTGLEGFDKGIDFVIFGKKVDLKTMGRTTPVRDYYVNNLIASQTSYETEFYVFSSINKTNWVMTVVGVIPKRNLEKYFLKEGTIRKRSDGSEFPVQTDMYEIPNRDLIQATNWLSLTWIFDQFN